MHKHALKSAVAALALTLALGAHATGVAQTTAAKAERFERTAAGTHAVSVIATKKKCDPIECSSH